MHIFKDSIIMIVIIIVIINHQFSEPIIKDSVLKTQVSLVLCCVLLKDPADNETIIVFFVNFLIHKNVVFSKETLDQSMNVHFCHFVCNFTPILKLYITKKNFTFGKGILSGSLLCLKMIFNKNQFTFGKRIVPRQRMQKSASSGGFPISSSCKVSTIVVIWKVSDKRWLWGNYIYLSAALEHSRIVCLI